MTSERARNRAKRVHKEITTATTVTIPATISEDSNTMHTTNSNIIASQPQSVSSRTRTQQPLISSDLTWGQQQQQQQVIPKVPYIKYDYTKLFYLLKGSVTVATFSRLNKIRNVFV